MKKHVFTNLFLFFLLTTGCGFKVVDHSKLRNFDIAEIITSGDNRINYKIKNKLIFNSKSNEKNLITVYLDTNKEKSVKEKNIKNEITKYQISITIKVKYKKINEDNFSSFEILKSANYSVSKQYSQTLNNEKKLIDQLTNDLANKILEELIFSLNAI
tara:strand:- start:4132 stop:4605 length:474 start_codon:yes stop_codon:yes gene_type:complete